MSNTAADVNENTAILDKGDGLAEETQPFIDIRGERTIKKQHLHNKYGRTVYVNNAKVPPQVHDDILQRERHNIYDDIDLCDFR